MRYGIFPAGYFQCVKKNRFKSSEGSEAWRSVDSFVSTDMVSYYASDKTVTFYQYKVKVIHYQSAISSLDVNYLNLPKSLTFI